MKVAHDQNSYLSLESEVQRLTVENRSLRQSLRDSQEMMQLAPAFFGFISVKGKILSVNDLAVQLTGLSREDIIGKFFWKSPWWNPLPESSAKIRKAFYEGIKGNDSQFDIEFWAARSNEKRWVSFQLKALRDSNGKIIRFSTTGIDITKRKHAEEILGQTQERLSRAIKVSKVGFYDWDILKNIVTYSEQMKKDWMIEGPGTLEDAINRIHPEDRSRIKKRIEEAMTNHDHYFAQYRVLRPDGLILWVEAQGEIFFDQHGRPSRFFGTALDISDRKLVEEVLQRSREEILIYAEAMPQMAFIADTDGRITYYNERFYKYLGLQPGQVEDWRWVDQPVVHPEDLEKAVNEWTAALKSGKPYYCEHRLRRHDGQYRHHIAQALPSKDSAGKIIKWYGTLNDIHDLVVAQEQLQSSLQTRDEFLSIASHELKTPLTSLKLQAQLFKRSIERNDPTAYSVAKVTQFSDQTNRQVSRLIRLVDDVLDIARIRSGKLTIKPEKFNLNTLISDLIARMKNEFLNASCGVPELESVDAVGNWDLVRIEQVATNLFTNAIRYGRGQPIKVKIWVERERVHLSVQDQGMGISLDSQKKIFDRFERGVNANEISGLGLGLYISRQIIEAHGGKIAVESQLNQGSTFVVELPYAK